jgi:hypothetical protein
LTHEARQSKKQERREYEQPLHRAEQKPSHALDGIQQRDVKLLPLQGQAIAANPVTDHLRVVGQRRRYGNDSTRDKELEISPISEERMNCEACGKNGIGLPVASQQGTQQARHGCARTRASWQDGQPQQPDHQQLAYAMHPQCLAADDPCGSTPSKQQCQPSCRLEVRLPPKKQEHQDYTDARDEGGCKLFHDAAYALHALHAPIGGIQVQDRG